MISGPNTLREQALSLLEEGKGREEVELLLLEQGHDDKFVKELVQEAIKLRHSKRIAEGLGLVLCGALICLVSCVLTITQNLSHEAFIWVLYGMTSVGILVVFAGLMRVF